MKQTDTVTLREATPSDTFDVYNWLYFSDFSDFLLSLYSHVNFDLPTYAEFRDGYPDYFFNGTKPNKGQSFIIQFNGEDIGHISYTSYHLLKGIAELDIWMKSNEFVGRRIGSTAIELLIVHLREKGFEKFIMRPSKQNQIAIKSYKRAGFVEQDPEYERFYNSDYVAALFSGDYGESNDVFLVKY